MNSIKKTVSAIGGVVNRFSKSGLIKNFAYVFSSAVLIKLALFVCYYLMARYFTVKEYGILTVLISSITTLASLSSVGLNQSLSRFATIFKSKNEEDKLIRLFSTVFFNLLAVSLFFCGVLMLFSDQFSELFLKSTDYSFLVKITAVGIPLMLLYQMNISFFTGLQDFKKVFWLNVIPYLVLFIISIFLIYGNKLSLFSSIVVFSFFPTSVIFVRFIGSSKSYFKWIYDKVIFKETLTFGKWMSLQSIVLVIQSRLDTYLLSYYTNPEQVSYYDIAFKVQGLILFMIGSFNTVILPKMTELSDNQSIKNAVNKMSKLILLISLTFLPLIVIVPYFLPFVFGVKYASSVVPLMIMLGSLIPHVWIFPFNNALYATGVSRPFFISVSLQLIANVIVSIILLPKYGAIGAAISYAVINVIALLNSLYFYRKHMYEKNSFLYL